MVRRLLGIAAMVLLAFLLLVGCGVPQEEHDAVVTERDAALSQVAFLQSDLVEAQGQIEKLESDVASAQSDLAATETELTTVKEERDKAQSDLSSAQHQVSSAQNQISSLQSELNKTESYLSATEEQVDRMEAVFGELLFFDDFADGDTEGWDFRGTEASWTVITEYNNQDFLSGVEQETGGPVLDLAPIRDASIIGSYDWIDYTLEFRICITEVTGWAGCWVDFRATPDLSESYRLGITVNSIHSINISKGPNMIAQSNLGSSLSGWNYIKVEVDGAYIRVYVDGVQKIGYTDPEPLERGGINFKVDSQYAKIYLDDVLVTRAK